MQKMYYIGQSYASSAFAKLSADRKKLAPKSENRACFVIANPNQMSNNARTEIESLSEMGDDELMLEVEAIRTLDLAFKEGKLSKLYQIKVNSSELLDAIFEECKVDLADRAAVLHLLVELHGKAIQPATTSPSKSKVHESGNKQREIMG